MLQLDHNLLIKQTQKQYLPMQSQDAVLHGGQPGRKEDEIGSIRLDFTQGR